MIDWKDQKDQRDHKLYQNMIIEDLKKDKIYPMLSKRLKTKKTERDKLIKIANLIILIILNRSDSIWSKCK